MHQSRRRRRGGATASRLPPALAALALAALTACADVTPPWNQTSRATIPGDSLTVRRVVSGMDVEVDPLRPEPGNVWPEEEAPRATLANPEEALRGIPDYQPPGAVRDAPPPPGSTTPGSPRRRARGSSSSPPELPPLPQADLRVPAAPAPPGATSPPPPRLDGRVIPVPGGPPAITSGGTDRVQTFTQPGQGGLGVAIPGGPTTTLIGPDGRVQQVPTPR